MNKFHKNISQDKWNQYEKEEGVETGQEGASEIKEVKTEMPLQEPEELEERVPGPPALTNAYQVRRNL